MATKRKMAAPTNHVGAVTFLELGRLVHELAKTPRNRRQGLLDKIHFHHLLLGEFLRSATSRTTPLRCYLDSDPGGINPAHVRVYSLALYRTLCVPSPDLSVAGLASSCVPQAEDIGGILAGREAIQDLARCKLFLIVEPFDRKIMTVVVRPDVVQKLEQPNRLQLSVQGDARPEHAPAGLPNLAPPHELAARISERVIGMDSAVRSFTASVYLHLQRARMLDQGADPNGLGRNIVVLLTGPSSSGKTFLCGQAAAIAGIPHSIFDSSAITVDGYVGLSISDAVESLIVSAGKNPAKARYGLLCLDEFDSRSSRGEQNGISSTGVQKSVLKLIEGMPDFVVGGRRSAFDRKTSFNSVGMLTILSGAFPELPALFQKSSGNRNGIGFGANAGGRGRISGDLLEVLQAYLIPELVNRISKVLILPEPTIEQLVKITTSPYGIIAQYNSVLSPIDAVMEFDASAVKLMAEYSRETKRFARGIQSIISTVVEELVFQAAPGSYTVDEAWIKNIIHGLDEEAEGLLGQAAACEDKAVVDHSVRTVA